MRADKYGYKSPTQEQVKRYYSVYEMDYCTRYAFVYESIIDTQKVIEYKEEKAKRVVICSFARN